MQFKDDKSIISFVREYREVLNDEKDWVEKTFGPVKESYSHLEVI